METKIQNRTVFDATLHTVLMLVCLPKWPKRGTGLSELQHHIAGMDQTTDNFWGGVDFRESSKIGLQRAYEISEAGEMVLVVQYPGWTSV